MFKRNEVEMFDDVTPTVSANGQAPRSGQTLRRRKNFGTAFRYWTLNALIGPALLLVALVIAAEGIANLLAITQIKIHRLPLPGVSLMAGYEGFSDLSLSHLISALLYTAVTLIWIRIIQEAKGQGTLLAARQQSPLVFWLYTTIAVVIISADAFLFYLGVASRGGGWGEMPFYVPAVCTALNAAAVACFAAFHADYINSDNV